MHNLEPCALCGVAPATRYHDFPVWGRRAVCRECRPVFSEISAPPPRRPAVPIWVSLAVAALALAPGLWEATEAAIEQARDGDLSGFGMPGALIFLAGLVLTIVAGAGPGRRSHG